ncbi:HNH endonuclease, partial [Chloroflexota bacterium]
LGMNFHLSGNVSLILMSLRPNAPYSDRVEDDGRVLIYEGHDISKTKETPIPKIISQPMRNTSGTLTQNGLFYEVAQRYKSGKAKSELVKV